MPDFFEQPILNSPYEYPSRHWETDAHGQPTNRLVERRRIVAFITPIPKPKKQRRAEPSKDLDYEREPSNITPSALRPAVIACKLSHGSASWRGACT